MLRVISLGWGVQSWALAAMSALGVLPPVDAVVHSDTGWERRETYQIAEKMTPWLRDHGIEVVTVRASEETRTAMLNPANGQTHIPLYTINTRDIYGTLHNDEQPALFDMDYPVLLHRAGQKKGMLRRSCTQRWKIAPLRKWQQEHRNGEGVAVWLGITLDEIERMKPSDVAYASNVYPFIDMFDKPWTRTMVVDWLNTMGLPVPVKSACVFCPYHSRSEWRSVMGSPDDWSRAVVVDQAIRQKRHGYFCYLNSQRKPLTECDFSQHDSGQEKLAEMDECEGVCFL